MAVELSASRSAAEGKMGRALERELRAKGETEADWRRDGFAAAVARPPSPDLWRAVFDQYEALLAEARSRNDALHVSYYGGYLEGLRRGAQPRVAARAAPSWSEHEPKSTGTPSRAGLGLVLGAAAFVAGVIGVIVVAATREPSNPPTPKKDDPK